MSDVEVFIGASPFLQPFTLFCVFASVKIVVSHMKQNMKIAETGSLSDVLDSECAGIRRCRETKDHKEAARAFIEKRSPVFEGR